MEASAHYRNDIPRLKPLSLGLSNVRHIVNKIEAECARTTVNDRKLVKYDPNIDEGTDGYYDSLVDSESTGRVWNRFAVNLGLALSKCIPRVTYVNFGIFAIAVGLFAPRMISYLVVYPICRLLFGTLYPAYASYKAVRTKNLKEYVKWMMYWIVFAFFTCMETFTDVFLSWFPFYYEVKIVLVLWLLSPATKGSSILYRKFVHPALCRREQEIDEYISKAKDQGYHTVLNLGTKGVNYATSVIMQSAIRGGGGLVQQLRKSYSLSDLSECEPHDERSADEADDVMTEPRLIRRVVKGGYVTRRSASESTTRSPMYFPEVDVNVRSDRNSRSDEPNYSHIKSTEDISSGYSSADNSTCLSRAGSLNAARVKARTTRTTVTTIKRPQAAEENEVIIEELHDDDTFDYANMPPLVTLPQRLYLSQSNPPFLYQYVGDQIRIVKVLGDPTNKNFTTKTDNTDQWDETEATFEDSISIIENVMSKNKEDPLEMSKNIIHNNTATDSSQKVFTEIDTHEHVVSQPKMIDESLNNGSNEEKCVISSIEKENDSADKFATKTIDTCFSKYVETSRNVVKDTDDPIETTSLDTSNFDNDSDESDDEASFGTPEDSPKTKRKGKYGKDKAPPPPLVESEIDKEISAKILDVTSNTTQESLVDIINRKPNINFKQSGTFKGLPVVNPIAEKKRRNKSKSPNRMQKGSSSGISKLLQLPGKLAFWNKSDDKSNDNVSTSSGDGSRRSSTIEKKDDFQSSFDLNQFADVSSDEAITIMLVPLKEDADDHISFKDAVEFESEAISYDIMEKSNALQKLIDAKIESHPEYKTVSLHEDIPTTSKSTDV